MIKVIHCFFSWVSVWLQLSEINIEVILGKYKSTYCPTKVQYCWTIGYSLRKVFWIQFPLYVQLSDDANASFCVKKYALYIIHYLSKLRHQSRRIIVRMSKACDVYHTMRHAYCLSHRLGGNWSWSPYLWSDWKMEIKFQSPSVVLKRGQFGL